MSAVGIITIERFAEVWLAWIVPAAWQLALVAAIVGIVNAGLRWASPSVRHALWLLVLVKVFLPPGLTTPVSMGRLVVAPLAKATGPWVLYPVAHAGPADEDAAELAGAERQPAGEVIAPGLTAGTVLLIAWAAGCLVFWMVVGWRYVRLVALARRATPIDEGPLRVALERIAIDLRLRRVPELLSTTVVASPFLFGVLRPQIVVPERLLGELNDVELRAVLAHELAHWRHHDTWIGWLQVIAQSIFWFHPLLWWANAELRNERELVCDRAVLAIREITPTAYGEAIVRVLTAARGRSLVGGSLVGVFERGGNLQNRLEDIMSYEPSKRIIAWPARLAVVVFAIAILPMAPGVVETRRAEADDGTDKSQPPQIVETTPAIGATGVDPQLKEISVTFDRDMKKGMSWTGGPPDFPPTDDAFKARWKDKRTCVLPVKLKKGSYYRVGINAPSYQNFRSTEDVPAEWTAILFTTTGATKALENKVRTPQVVKLEPANGAKDVDPSTSELRVTFNVPMSDGMSWTGSGVDFPKFPDGKEPVWSADALTCTLPVTLEPSHDYRLGLNSQSFKNFQSAAGVALKPVVYKFRTSAN